MMKNNFLLIFLMLLFSFHLSAQISLGGTPKSFQLNLDDNDIQEVVLPLVDVKALEAEDIERAADNMPYRFAFGFPVSYNLDNIGTWTELPNGDRIWQLKISCQQALSVNLLYDDFFIPQGGLYYIYSADRSEIIGGFGAHNNRASRKFATGIVNSTNIVLEYYEPAAVSGQGSISVGQVSHAYRGFQNDDSQSEGLGDAGSCQVNINCSPEGDDWQTEKKGVARIIINGVETCTGTLINNVAQNCTPYFLTANHCIDGSFDAVTNPDLSGAVFYWNYERAGCANTGPVPDETTSGATVVANADPVGGDANASDFALFELTEDPSDVYDVYAVGFDASGAPGNSGAGIHHPGLDAKKIATHSIVPDVVVNDNYWRIFWDATLNGHSVTEGGSSGSALFNDDKRLIGQLFGGFLGGQPNCSDPAADEGDYGRLSVSWNNAGATDARRRLRDWLDPNNSGQTVVDGRSCMVPDYVLSADPLSSTNCGGNTADYTIDVESRNGFSDPVTLSVSGLPAGASASFGTNPVTPGNSTGLTISGLDNVADGSYSFDVNGSSTTGNKTLALSLDVADQSAAILISPADGATDVSTFPNLMWNAAIGAASYDVEVATDAGFANVVASANVTNPNWIVNPVLNTLTTYFWRVRHVRSCGIDPWSNAFSFTTGEANPGTCGNPIELVCGGTFSGNNANGENNFEQHDPGGANSWTGPELIFEFEAAAGNVEAQITGLTADLDFYLFTDCGDPVNSELDESESTASTETVSATVSAGTYYLMVDGFQGATSDFDLTLTCTPPTGCGGDLGSVTLLTPTDGATDVNTTPTLTWMANAMADSYDVQVATDAGFSNVVASTNVTAATWMVSPDLVEGTNYFWRIRYVRACGNDPWSAAFSFTTICTDIGSPTLNTPANGAIDVSTSPSLTWSANAAADSYDVEVATDAGFSNVVASANVATANWTVSPALNANTTYFWRARFVKNCGTQAWSSAFSFTTLDDDCTGDLGAPTLNSPTNGAMDVSTSPNLAWSSNVMADSYDVEVATDAGFSNVVASANVANPSWTVSPALNTNTTYFWRAKFVKDCGIQPWSSTSSFTTEEMMTSDCFTATSTTVPVNIPNSTTVSSTINITSSGSISDVNVSFSGTHGRVRDLTFELQSPSGTRIQLVDVDDPCNGRQRDFDFGFDDQSTLTIDDDLPCPPTSGLNYQPEQALSAFDGQEVNGTWTLFVTDGRNRYDGQLTAWQLDICVGGGMGGPTCNDGIQNGDEEGVDCGGSCPNACPTCDDGIQNGLETGIDCGGPDCAPCMMQTCDIPTGLFETNNTGSSITLNWTNVPAANTYTIQGRQQGSNNWQITLTANTNSINVTNNIVSGVTYEWRVRSNCDDGSSDYSTIATFTAGSSASSDLENRGGTIDLDAVLQAKVYPSPTSELLNIASNQFIEQIEVLDMTGKVISKIRTNSENTVTQLNINYLTNGHYFIRIKTEKDVQTLRFVKI